MNETVTSNLKEIGLDVGNNLETSISDFYRRGKHVPGKHRPIILRASNIWMKRKIMASFNSKRDTLPFTIREDHPLNPQLKNLKEQARKLNDDLKKKAKEENLLVTKSYSARDTGLVTFIFKNGKWQKE